MRSSILCFCALVLALGCQPDQDWNPGGDTVDPAKYGPPPPRYFPDEAVWYQDVSGAPLDTESAPVMGRLTEMGGFGDGSLQIDFEMDVVAADETAPFLDFTPARGFYKPDCDQVPVPIPVAGVLEGEADYHCSSPANDCHLIVHHLPTNKLYEMWHADITGGVFTGGCLAVWDLTRVYAPTGRGLGCTSADAAGYPIAPLLFSADEVAAGEIPHAIRFVMPNDRIRGGVYLAPATHSTEAAKGDETTPPFGARLRLRADFPINQLRPGARVVARALQRYGMFLADGGTKALTARSDRYTRAKWSTGPRPLLGPRDLVSVKISDFEMVDGGPRIPFSGDCAREP